MFCYHTYCSVFQHALSKCLTSQILKVRLRNGRDASLSNFTVEKLFPPRVPGPVRVRMSDASRVCHFKVNHQRLRSTLPLVYESDAMTA